MSIDSIATLLAVLRRTQLISTAQVEEIRRELAPHYRDPVALLEYLVEVDWLTAYQVELLLTDQWDELTIGPFNVLDRLGQGGISEVFKAWDTVRGRVVALKVLHQHLASQTDVVRQFRRELEAITRLSHPNVIKTFAAHQDGAMHYFAMEFVEGKDLDRYIRDTGPLPIEQACDYARQTAQGLQHAHQSGLVHRDIKPANLFLVNPPSAPGTAVPGKRQDPIVKVLDWGLARCLREPEDAGRPPSSTAIDLDAEKGSLIGTADYIAPEQAHDARLVDIRADIYSLGCTLFYLLTGRTPFAGSTLIQKLRHHQEDEAPSVRAIRPDVPEELDGLVRKMMYKSPANRPQIPLLLVAALKKFCQCGTGVNGTEYRPGSWSGLPSTGAAPSSTINMARPSTHAAMHRPGTSTDLVRPITNGNGHLSK